MRLFLAVFAFVFTFGSPSSGQIIIPVVVHVVYSNSDQNISEEQVHSQIEALNRDYQMLNSDISNVDSGFENLTASIGVEFQLASYDPDGISTSGITKTETTHGVFGNSDIHYNAQGGQDIWGVNDYLNIWVCDLTPQVLGYASSPDLIDERDGLVIDYTNFGEASISSDYNLGRTAVHEVGHWLGLIHPEGLGDCENDDGITDTPNQELSYSSCLIDRNDCGSSDMTQNFMQSGVDACLLFFTTGQAVRMNEVLANERSELVDNANSVLGLFSSNVAEHRSIVYPNPIIDGVMKLHLPEGDNYQMIVQSLDGSTLVRRTISENENIDLNGFSQGLYLLSIASEQGNWIEKIEIE